LGCAPRGGRVGGRRGPEGGGGTVRACSRAVGAPPPAHTSGGTRRPPAPDAPPSAFFGAPLPPQTQPGQPARQPALLAARLPPELVLQVEVALRPRRRRPPQGA